MVIEKWVITSPKLFTDTEKGEIPNESVDGEGITDIKNETDRGDEPVNDTVKPFGSEIQICNSNNR